MTTALRAVGALASLNARGIFSTADVHVAQRLCALAGETDERVHLALALAVRSVRGGSVMVDLSKVALDVRAEDGEPVEWPSLEDWRSSLDQSPVVGGPLHREDDRIWLHGYWQQELFIAEELLRRAAVVPVVDRALLKAALARLWPGADADDQRMAAAVCALSSVGVLGGGPGTGKTTTVARLLAALWAASPGGEGLRVALAAPTGKAAARLRESMARADKHLSLAEAEALTGLPSFTLHRLLGVRRGSDRFWHDASNRLPYDVVVVDEASMVSLSMFAKLLEALRPDARLILVGDPDQLVSVEAGAVLADLAEGTGGRTAEALAALDEVVPHDAVAALKVASTLGARLRDGMALLTTTRRYEGEGPIDLLARAVKASDADEVVERLKTGDAAVRFIEVADDKPVPTELLRDPMVAVARAVAAAAAGDDAVGALKALDQHRLLCAHREGPRGVGHWERQMQAWLRQEGIVVGFGRYAGQPLLITANDYDNRLWNGDTGVVVQEVGGLCAYFSTGGDPTRVPLGRLGNVRPMHAMTVHRSQGSQFAEVTYLLPPATSPLGTRETLYTAISRAEKRVTVVGSEAALRASVGHPVRRASGLPARLG